MEQEGAPKEDNCSSLNPPQSDEIVSEIITPEAIPSDNVENITKVEENSKIEEETMVSKEENTSSELKSSVHEVDSTPIESTPLADWNQSIHESNQVDHSSESVEESKNDGINTANNLEKRTSCEESKELHMFTDKWTFWYVYTMSHEERKRK